MINRVSRDLGVSISEAEELLRNKEVLFDRETGKYYIPDQESWSSAIQQMHSISGMAELITWEQDDHASNGCTGVRFS